jgi:ABC-type nitrate/sulfonate/bicarbonate transport system substrate-binding protein
MGPNRSGHPVLRIVSIALALLAADGGFSMAKSAEPTPFKLGLSEPVNTALALWMAEAGGFYAARGLKVEIINMSGGSRGAQELQNARLDAMHVGLSSVVRINRSGGDLRVVAALSNVIRFTFFSAPGVKTPADLKGGVVGVSTFGSESDATVTLALRKLGLTRDDITVKEYGGGMRRLEALKSGEIKATSVNEPVSSLAREQGLNVMVDLVPEQIAWLFTAVVVKKSSLENRREAMVQFVRAVIEGNYLALTDEKRAKEVLAKEAKITDPKILDISYNDFKKQAPLNTEPTREGVENILAQFPTTGSTNVADYVDISILDQLKREGFFAELQRKYPTAR